MTPDVLDDIVRSIASASPDLEPLLSVVGGDVVVSPEPPSLFAVMRELRAAGFDRLGMVTAVDRDDHFELVYRIHSRRLSVGAFVKTTIDRDGARIESVNELWPAALWQEREAFDLFGIEFTGHPDLRRILLPDDFEGHPLRRDYDDARMIRRPDYI